MRYYLFKIGTETTKEYSVIQASSLGAARLRAAELYEHAISREFLWVVTVTCAN